MNKWLILFLSVVLISLIGCSSAPQAKAMESVGVHDSTVFLVLNSRGQITNAQLGDILRGAWQDHLINGKIFVMVFDDKGAAQGYLNLESSAIDAIPDAEYQRQTGIYELHHIASYSRNKASGENTCFFYSGDPSGKATSKIDY